MDDLEVQLDEGQVIKVPFLREGHAITSQQLHDIIQAHVG